jgi:hypothetical protein
LPGHFGFLILGQRFAQLRGQLLHAGEQGVPDRVGVMVVGQGERVQVPADSLDQSAQRGFAGFPMTRSPSRWQGT